LVASVESAALVESASASLGASVDRVGPQTYLVPASQIAPLPAADRNAYRIATK
jgi:hypothetical protein